MPYSIELELYRKSEINRLRLKIQYLTELIESDYAIICEMKNHGVKATNPKYHAVYARHVRYKHVRANYHEKLKAMGVNYHA